MGLTPVRNLAMLPLAGNVTICFVNGKFLLMTRCVCTVFYYVEHADPCKVTLGCGYLKLFSWISSALLKIYSSTTVTGRRALPHNSVGDACWKI